MSRKPHIRRYGRWPGYWSCGLFSEWVRDGGDYVGKSPREAYEGWMRQFQ